MEVDQSGLLHITNGDSAADIISACGVSGHVLPWRDPMHHGPFLAGLSLDELSRVRIGYLNGDEQSPQQCLESSGQHDFSERDAVLASSPKFEEIVLWFEHDLLDQLQILQLLDWFASADVTAVKLSLICIDEFDGVSGFRGIGQLTPEQMGSLFSSRQPVTKIQLDLAQNYWAAFCSTDPQNLLKLVSHKLTNDDLITPYMQAALMRHCQEFPWVSDGLTRTERQLLTLVAGGVTKPLNLFLDNMDYETCLYIGDGRTYSQIAELCSSDHPLLACVSGERFIHPHNSGISSDAFNEQHLYITDLGKSVLDGSVGAIDTLTRNSWLGGVHLNSELQMWLWDDQRRLFHFPR